jgi:hypothetical protein
LAKPWSAGRTSSPEERRRTRRRARDGIPSRRSVEERFIEADKKPKRVSVFAGLRSRVDTDLRREQSPGVAGHLGLLVLRAGGWDVRNGKRATAPKGVRLCGGEKLWRVNPMSGTGPRDRKAVEGGNRQEGEKP